MATTSIISYTIVAESGKQRSLPIYFPATFSITDLQTWLTQDAPLLDAAIGGKIVEANVTLAMTLPGGLKSAPDAGSDNGFGALVNFDCTGTDYTESLWVPSWNPAGFSSGTNPQVINTGVYAAFLADIVGGATAHASDKFANDIAAYLTGKKSFRK